MEKAAEFNTNALWIERALSEGDELSRLLRCAVPGRVSRRLHRQVKPANRAASPFRPHDTTPVG